MHMRSSLSLTGVMVTTTLTLTALGCLGPAVAAEIDFNQDIRPLLSDRCFHCHGPDEEHRKAGLRLDTVEGITADLGGYAAVVPGDADQSMLVDRISSEDRDEIMPPPDSGKSLSDDERDLIRRWIEEGAVWAEHWAYVAPVRRPLPPVAEETWPLNAIDHFILSRLEKEGLNPSPDADRATLLRRLSFDLTGLPPTPEETQAFLNDISPEAYERAVDDFLASEHFGERMAMYWLDLVRFADTVGYHGDQDHSISPYRDYVIDAFNENVPFDQFTREQLAGDLLPGSGVDEKIASGYNRLLQTSHEGGVQPKEYLAIYAADRVRNVSTVWMGATMGCAQCHDHKFDPYTIRDFYTMAAFFADIDEEGHFSKGSNDLPTHRPPEMAVLTKRERRALAALEVSLEECEAELRACLPAAVEKREALKARRKQLESERERLQGAARKTMITVAKKKPRTTRVLPRGNWLDDSGEVVLPAIPEFLGGLDLDGRRATRLDLARWLTEGASDSGRMTARVFANRFWYLMFGSGLSGSLDDFGGQGEPPMHPELLDHLALTFVESGWNVKALIKQLVMSRAYRQSSLGGAALVERDPDNRLYGRQSAYRLPAEMIRDAALRMSGLLDEAVGGPSVKPYQPKGYYRHLNFPQRKYAHDKDQRQWRRGVYVHWQRQFLHPMMRAFDAPSREECTAERSRSNTPTAALTLLNDPTFVEAARVLAERLLRAVPGDPRRRFHRAFLIVLCRAPREEEIGVLERLLAANATYYAKQPEAARELLRNGQAPVPSDLDPIELASWTAVSRALLNLDETITRH